MSRDENPISRPGAAPALSYKDAGVDIDKADGLVEDFQRLGQATQKPGVLCGIGGFGAMFSLFAERRYDDPVLVSGTDGVGTKLLIAEALNRYGTIGVDLVAMCVNDIVCTGARPLFFLDYYATAHLDAERCQAVVGGIADGCAQADCALVGGETAELPGVYPEGGFDLAGFAVGVVERAELVDGTRVVPGDAIFALPSSGVHSNGFSLARRVVTERLGGYAAPCAHQAGATWGEVLLAPTRIYASAVAALRDAKLDVRAMAHITGGGLPGNLLRPYPAGCGADITADRAPPTLFAALQAAGRVDRDEMRRTFNMGIGYCITVPEEAAGALTALAAQTPALDGLFRLGTVRDHGEVRYLGDAA